MAIESVTLSNYLILCHPSWITALSWRRGMCNSMKLKAMQCRATQDRRVIVKSYDKTWSTGGGNGKPLPYSHRKNPINSIKRQKDVMPKYEPSRWKGAQYAAGKQQRAITNSFRRNQAAWPKQKQCSVVNVSGAESKMQCCKEPYCIGTWNVRFMNQGKLDVVKQETARVNIRVMRELILHVSKDKVGKGRRDAGQVIGKWKHNNDSSHLFIFNHVPVTRPRI